MGLDMYLKANRYISAYFLEEQKYDKLTKEIAEIFPESGEFPVSNVQISVAYWRKANAIHKWFVDNVQDGVDDCGNYPVYREQLEQLYASVCEVLEDNSKAPELLPTQGGFFFGDTSYDEWYFSDLKETKTILSKILNNPELNKNWDFEYHSSW